MLAAASVTSLVMICHSLIFSTRLICGNSRSTTVKMPWVSRFIAISASSLCAGTAYTGSAIGNLEKMMRERGAQLMQITQRAIGECKNTALN